MHIIYFYFIDLNYAILPQLISTMSSPESSESSSEPTSRPIYYDSDDEFDDKFLIPIPSETSSVEPSPEPETQYRPEQTVFGIIDIHYGSVEIYDTKTRETEAVDFHMDCKFIWMFVDSVLYVYLE